MIALWLALAADWLLAQTPPQAALPPLIQDMLKHGGADIAFQSADGRHVYVMSGAARAISIWDRQRDAMVRSLMIPEIVAAPDKRWKFDRAAMLPDGKTLQFSGTATDPGPGSKPIAASIQFDAANWRFDLPPPAVRSVPAGLAPPGPAEPAITPRIVLQNLTVGGIDAAAWTPDSRHLIAASGVAAELLLFDVRNRVLVDRLRLPNGAPGKAAMLHVQRLLMAPDGKSVRVEAVVRQLADTRATSPASARIAYDVDLDRRSVRVAPPPPVSPGQPPEPPARRVLAALAAIYGYARTDMPIAEANAILPSLPASPDGQWQLVRQRPALALVRRDGARFALPQQQGEKMGLDHAALSPDGRRLALVDTLPYPEPGGPDRTPLEIFDLVTGRHEQSIQLPGDYDRAHWMSGELLAVMEETADDPDDPGSAGNDPLPILIIDGKRKTQRPVTPRCFAVPLDSNRLIAAGIANCRRGADADTSLQSYDLSEGFWRPLPNVSLPRGARIKRLAVAPRGNRIAVLVVQAGTARVQIIDVASGSAIASWTLAKGLQSASFAFSDDGTKIHLAGQGQLFIWSIDGATDRGNPIPARVLAKGAPDPVLLAHGNGQLLVGDPGDEAISRVSLADGTAQAGLDIARPVAGGFVPGKPLFWAAGHGGEVKIWDARSWAPLVTTSFAGDGRFIAVAQDGRYDSNVGIDAGLFRWLMADDPWQSLPPQTFMRDYFEPRLLPKLVDCAAAGTCAATMPPLPPVASLNRLLPEFRIAQITPLADKPGWIEVMVEGKEQLDPSGKRRSGLFAAKLLLNNREVAGSGETYGNLEFEAALQDKQLALRRWRNGFRLEPDQDGVARVRFRIPIPSDGLPIQLSTYGYNSDRVKSETSMRVWQPPPMPPRQRRAYVLTIGIDEYEEQRLNLTYAAADANLIADRLARIPGYEVRQARLTTARLPDRRIRWVTRDDIALALTMLATGRSQQMVDLLRERGHDVEALDAATPDDVVIISISSHGHADASGRFGLIASDARWPVLADGPDWQTIIAGAALPNFLGYLSAGEIAIIIDACHSGAAVQSADFKPGPMGDSGLAQLSFDKGIRILAATQADDVALESGTLAHGFLSAALGEGLSADGGPADTDRDGTVRLDEWLRYAVARLPSLNEEVRRGGGPLAARGVRMVMRNPNAAPPRVQEPSLFDFNPLPSPVALRGQP